MSITCHVYVEEKQRRALFGGLSDGDVCMWRAKREGASKSGSDMVNVLLKGHRGMNVHWPRIPWKTHIFIVFWVIIQHWIVPLA